MSARSIFRQVTAGLVLALAWPAAGAAPDSVGDLVEGVLKDFAVESQADDLALMSNSYLGDLTGWNGVDSDRIRGAEREAILAKGPAPWGWSFNYRYPTRLTRIAGKDIPLSTLLAVPATGSYRIWLRRIADTAKAYPVELKISGASRQTHVFGKVILTPELCKEQEKSLPIRFESESLRATLPSGVCQVWEYWDTDLNQGDCLFELSPLSPDARLSYLFISASKSVTPRLPREPYNRLMSLEQHQDSTLSRVYYRFRVRDGDSPTYQFSQSSLMYHSMFDPFEDTFGVGVRMVGLAQESFLGKSSQLPQLPLSAAGKPEIPCGEWTGWLDATWSTQGAGSWATGVLGFGKLKKGQCDIALAWYPHPAGVVKTITVEVEEGQARFIVPLIAGGQGKIVFADRENKQGVWGVFGRQYLERFKTTADFVRQYMSWVEDAKAQLGITETPRLPAGLWIAEGVNGATEREKRELARVLLAMGFNGMGLSLKLCRELGVEPRVKPLGRFDGGVADPARPLLVRQEMEQRLQEALKTNPDYAAMARLMCVADEVGLIAGASDINRSANGRQRWRRYLGQTLADLGQTPEFFGVADLSGLPCLGELNPAAGLYERRLYNHSQKFLELVTAEFFGAITAAANDLYPHLLTYANYTPAPLRQSDQTMNGGGWFHNMRLGGLSMAWGEDWATYKRGYTGYEIVSYYAALVECAARKFNLASGFYTVPYSPPADTHLVSILSRNIKTINIIDFGPLYNCLGGAEGNWSESKPAYLEIVKGLHVAAFAGQPLGAGRPEPRRVALLYNRDDELMQGGYNGQQSDRALVFAALGNCHRNADIILNEDLTPALLEPYGAVFLNGFCLPRAAAPALRQWVEKGGLLVATARAGVYDEYNAPLPEMEALYGARQLGLTISKGYFYPMQMNSHRPIDTITIQETEFSPALTGAVVGVKTTLQPTTGRPIAAFADGSCAAVVNSVGKGHVLLWGIQPGFLYKGRREGSTGESEASRYADERLAIFEKPLQRALGPAPVSIDAPQVELTRFELDGETAILLNNFKRYAWSADLPPATLKVKTSQNVKEVAGALSGKLAWRREGDWVFITLPVPQTIESIRMR